jgi:hypothetical protein
MLLRIRWFIMGVLTSIGVVAYLVSQVKAARERLTPENLARTGARSLAGALESAAVAITPAPRDE